MRKIIIIAAIFFLLAAPCFADFRFAVIGDTRDYSSDGINAKTMKVILEKIKQEEVDFIVVTGDMITGSAKSSIHRNRLKKWKGIIERYGISFYIGVGNHEIESEMSENIIRSVFEMPENGPNDFKELIYSFDYKNTHFIMLDTEAFNNFHAIGEVQLKWLKEDVKKNQKKTIFIFGHDPAYPVYNHIGSSLDKHAVERDELWGIFKKYNVSAYICGHEHLYNRSIHNGVYQIIAGGGGAPVSVPEEKGGFYNFIVIDVKDDEAIEITVKDINGFVKDTFSIK
nr:metallophosphoesterase [Candidatus Omnitrophota bacterium]